MRSYKNRVAIRVMSVHISVILLALVIPFLRGCFRSKPKELITFIEFGSPPAAVETVNVPAHTPSPPSHHEPPPQIENKIPDPPKDRTPPKQTEHIKPPRRHSSWKRTSVDEIRKEIKNTQRVRATSTTPTLTQREIEQNLRGIVNHSHRIGNSTSFAAYEATVTRIFTQAWRQPSAPGRRPAKVKIFIQDSGKIIRRTLIQKSGDSEYDQTVMRAVRSISVLPRPPKGYPDRTFIIKFKFQ